MGVGSSNLLTPTGLLSNVEQAFLYLYIPGRLPSVILDGFAMVTSGWLSTIVKWQDSLKTSALYGDGAH
ncbi:MAG: hypothetical protein N2044_12590 [Cyclobacteriaceae bacterium]|nr:hypothetical protein [Cyclobacteriaceae bacterium]MCX7638674.1 hypothetical protein [Cyclobacteriaceae bacterium]